MKIKSILLTLAMLLIVSCTSRTPAPTGAATAIPSMTPSPTHQPTPTATSAPAFPPETRLKQQCLEILPELPSDFVSSGIVVLGRRVGENRSNFETILLDMATGQTTSIITQNQSQGSHVVSSDRKIVAYSNIIYDAKGERMYKELIVQV